MVADEREGATRWKWHSASAAGCALGKGEDCCKAFRGFGKGAEGVDLAVLLASSPGQPAAESSAERRSTTQSASAQQSPSRNNGKKAATVASAAPHANAEDDSHRKGTATQSQSPNADDERGRRCAVGGC